MKIRNKNKLEVPQEIHITTESLKKALEDYPNDGGILISSSEPVVMETPKCGRILTYVTLRISVAKQLE
jgi:hypothetical protein